MKKIIKSALFLLCSVCILTACEDDNDSNPVLRTPDSFVMNTPSYATSVVDLKSSTALNFSWQYPDYGFPVSVNYQLQLSVNGKFDKAFNPNLKASDQSVDFITTDAVYQETKGALTGEAFATALQKIALYQESNVPATQKVYVRAFATVKGDTVYSNPITIIVAPYYVELKDAPVEIWYLIGGCIGNGSWTNSKASIGVGMIPLSPIEGQEYDRKTGKGKIGYKGYFPANASFKILEKVGNWDYGMCGDGTDKGTTYRSGGSDPGNISIAEAGYYYIELDTKAHTCTIKKIDDPSSITVFTTFNLPGDYNSWNETSPMTAVETYAGAINHNWTATVTITAKGGVKFKSGTSAYGGTVFPSGVAGTTQVSKIPVEPGTYVVVFNDITGGYTFVEQ
ncbi:SusE domain-containing protein [Hoylesella marshii]|uniref:SusE outer membrane protein domain-containing protein n=1 Tax=Hoylesella marshii DSM 16973 = JCM 13450 TaxID=862515 RepID=E0NS07_9BACT|nr:SusE domain-containing protein [Hoylesella marshii]EFM02101.1 hypothetical protein HMPREF0658_0958 [Hoylesella marshii DSM 16973 = JCM 13450]